MATKSKQPKKLGRPPAEFTPRQLHRIDRMAFMQARDYTIAEAMGMEVELFRRHFKKRCSQKRAEGKLELHETQYEMAKKQVVMAIWLGKQHLEQADKAEVKGSFQLPPIQVEIVKEDGHVQGQGQAEACGTGGDAAIQGGPQGITESAEGQRKAGANTEL